MKILRPQPSSVMKERCGWWGEGGHLSVVVSQLWGDALYLFFSLRVEWNVITSRWRLLWKCSVYITACSKGTKRIFFLRIHFLSSSEHYQAKKKKHTHTHTHSAHLRHLLMLTLRRHSYINSVKSEDARGDYSGVSVLFQIHVSLVKPHASAGGGGGDYWHVSFQSI